MIRCQTLHLLVLVLSLGLSTRAQASGERLVVGYHAGPASVEAEGSLNHVDALLSSLLSDALGCRLFTGPGEFQRFQPELAYGLGELSDEGFLVSLVDGARFHDGEVITAGLVVQALQRRMGERSAIAHTLRKLNPRVAGPHRLLLDWPTGSDPTMLREILAHEDASITHLGEGRAEVGCGAYRLVGVEPSRHLLAFDGHPRGRPYLDEVFLRGYSARDLAARHFIEGKLIALTLNHERLERESRRRRGAKRFSKLPDAAWLTHYLEPSATMQSEQMRPFRATLWAALRGTKVHRQLEGDSEPGYSLWPALLRSFERTARPTKRESSPRNVLRIAVPDTRAGIDGLANAVASELERALGVQVQLVALGAGGEWDFSLKRLRWRSRSPSLAVEELAQRLAISGCPTINVLRRDCRDTAIGIERSVPVIPLAHERLSLMHARRLMASTRGGRFVLDDSRQRPR